MPDDFLDRMKSAGLCFMKGAPPETEDGYFLLDLGDCHAFTGWWAQDGSGRLRCDAFDKTATINPDLVDGWMRLPHPRFWPVIERPAQLRDERELYEEGKI